MKIKIKLKKKNLEIDKKIKISLKKFIVGGTLKLIMQKINHQKKKEEFRLILPLSIKIFRVNIRLYRMEVIKNKTLEQIPCLIIMRRELEILTCEKEK